MTRAGTDAESGRDTAEPLVRALLAAAPDAGLRSIASRRWASATFAGERHVIRLEAADTPALADWLAALPEAELDLRHALVADLAVAAVERQDGRADVTLEVLTLERD